MNISRRISGIISGIIAFCCFPAANAQRFQTPPPEIVSAWKLDGENLVVVFRYDGTYHLIDGNQGETGMEYGTFTWDRETGVFTANVITDTNGDAGFSDSAGNTTISISGNTLNFLDDGDDDGVIPFTRVTHTPGSIVGSWAIPGDRFSVTFLANNTYFLSQDSDESPAGIEVGTYNWNPTTKSFSATATIDTNGDAGINGVVGATVNITGNSLLFDDGEDPTTLLRITANSDPVPLPAFGALRAMRHSQTSDANPALLAFDEDGGSFPYYAEAFVNQPVGANAPTLKIGSGSPIPLEDKGDSEFRIEEGFASLASLNSLLPNSSTLLFQDGDSSATLSTAATGTFPSTPKIILREGSFWENGVYRFGDDQVLQWILPVGFVQSQFATFIEIFDPVGGGVVLESLLLIQGETTFLDLAEILDPDKEYEVMLEFLRLDQITTLGGGKFAGQPGYVLSASSTNFRIRSAANDTGDDNQYVELLIINKRRFSEQQSPTLLSPTSATFDAQVEGVNLTATFPASDIRVFRPDQSSLPLSLGSDGDSRWEMTEEFVDLAALQASFPSGIYGISIGADFIPIAMPAAGYPNQPLITSSAGSWVDGKLQINASQAAAGFTLTSNASNGNGFLSINVIETSSDSDIVKAVVSGGSDIVIASVPPGELSPGESYEVETEFDNVVSFSHLTDKSWGLSPDGTATTFGLLSSTTFFFIEVLPDPVETPYSDWQSGFFTPEQLADPAISGDDVDFDNDGIDNLLEFVLGGSPTSPNPNLLKNATTTPAADGRNLVFFYDRKTVANGITQVIETSPTLTGTWSPAVHGVNDVVIATTPLDGQTERVTATIPSTEPKLFVRLKASR